MPCDDCLSRREFLSRSTVAVAGAAALAAGCGDGQFGPTALKGTTTAVTIKVSTLPGLATIGQLVKLPQSGGNAGAPILIAVKRTGTATFAAFSTVCTHQGCETNIKGTLIECPCHLAQYDFDGRVTRQPFVGSATNLPAYTTRYDATTDTLTIG